MSVVRTVARQPASGLGFTVPATLDLASLPSWLKDWRVLAGIAAAVVILLAMMAKGGKKQRRKQLMAARLKYAEEAARIRRKA